MRMRCSNEASLQCVQVFSCKLSDKTSAEMATGPLWIASVANHAASQSRSDTPARCMTPKSAHIIRGIQSGYAGHTPYHAQPDDLNLVLKCNSLHLQPFTKSQIKPKDWTPGEVAIPECHCQRCREHMFGLTFDENTTEDADMSYKPDDSHKHSTDLTAKRRRSEPVCQILERHSSDHDLEIVSMPPPLHRKGEKPALQQRRASAPAPQVTHRPHRAHIQITIPDIADDHSSREHREATISSAREHRAQRAENPGKEQDREQGKKSKYTDANRTAAENTSWRQDRSCTPQQRSNDTAIDRAATAAESTGRKQDRSCDIATERAAVNSEREQNRSWTTQQRRTSSTARGSIDNHEQRVGAVSTKPVKLIQKKDSTNERRNSIQSTGNKTRTTVRTPRAKSNETNEESSRIGKVRVVSITATVRRQSKSEDTRKGTRTPERPATPKVTPRRQSVPQRRMSSVNGSKAGVRRKSVPANIRNRTTKGKQKSKREEKDSDNDQNEECDQVVSSRHIASDPSLTSAMDQQFSTISIKCPSSENITIMQDLQNSQSLNSSSCGLFQVELNRAFTYSYFQFLPPHFPK